MTKGNIEKELRDIAHGPMCRPADIETFFGRSRRNPERSRKKYCSDLVPIGGKYYVKEVAEAIFEKEMSR